MMREHNNKLIEVKHVFQRTSLQEGTGGGSSFRSPAQTKLFQCFPLFLQIKKPKLDMPYPLQKKKKKETRRQGEGVVSIFWGRGDIIFPVFDLDLGDSDANFFGLIKITRNWLFWGMKIIFFFGGGRGGLGW